LEAVGEYFGGAGRGWYRAVEGTVHLVLIRG
jgi:hypothetical protein